MKVFIGSGASKTIDESYLTLARETSEYLADQGLDLVFGGANFSMMGECFRTFIKKGRSVEAFTVKFYEDDLKELEGANCHLVSNTLERFYLMYDLIDIFVILPGGIGTLSEFVSALEEFRSNREHKLIIIYNKDGYYNKIFEWMNENINTGFLAQTLNNDYKVVDSLDLLKYYVEDFIKWRADNEA